MLIEDLNVEDFYFSTVIVMTLCSFLYEGTRHISVKHAVV